MRCGRAAVLLLVVAVELAAAAEGDEDEGSCLAGAPCSVGEAASARHEGPLYPWPMIRGRAMFPSKSLYQGPKNLSRSLAWTWQHPLGQYSVVLAAGPLIDDKKNIYQSTTEQVFKFSPDGTVLWRFDTGMRMSDSPAISDGKFYSTCQGSDPPPPGQPKKPGQIFALSMETGQKVWGTDIPEGIGGDIAALGVLEGLILASLGKSPHGGTARVACFNGSDGTKLWEYEPPTPLWNFIPMYTGKGSFLFQTENGDAVHLRLTDGKELWKVTRPGRGWTDGGMTLGPNGIAYVVHAEGHMEALTPTQPSDISAYRVEDGKLLWRHHYLTPPNSWPVIAPFGDDKRLTVLFPYGGQSYQSVPGTLTSMIQTSWTPMWAYHAIVNAYLGLGSWGVWLARKLPSSLFREAGGLMVDWPGGVTAFDPETGKVLWSWVLPDWPRPEVKGDDAGFMPRVMQAIGGKLFGQVVCIPNPWASPTVDADGTMYLGWQDGNVYAVREEAGLGRQVDVLETTAGFSHPGPAMGPGIMAVANCDTLYVFKY
mmetsp:Transcript_68326/g.193594  ORF Transcript_68326/g.193594 Transcript_68326/m.193594 type:complete len:538 (+) Transcript_68326:45-1658(+)